MGKMEEHEKKLLEAMHKYPVIVHKNFCLFHAGEKGSDFFDLDRLIGKPLEQKNLLKSIKNKIEDLEKKGMRYNKIAFVDKESGPVGAIVLASALSQELGKEIIILRPWKKLKFDHLKVKGRIEDVNDKTIKPNDLILLIDDVITTGDVQKRAIEIIERFKAKVTGLISVFVRKNEVIEDLKKEKKINYIESIWTYDTLSSLGFILAQSDTLLSKNFVREFVNQSISEEKVPYVEKEIDNQLEEIISDILEKKHISADQAIKQGLKNLYFNTALYRNQEKVLEIISRNK